MDVPRHLDHEELLTLARKAQAAAHDGDGHRVEAQSLRLFEALAEHVLAERAALLQIPPGDAHLLERGQQRVLDVLIELVASATTDEHGCHCDQLADRLLAALSVQADDERHHLPAAPA